MSDTQLEPETVEAEENNDAVGLQINFDRNYRLLADVPMRLSVEVGNARLKIAELLDLNEGSIVELDRQTHELLDIMANGTLIARGEVVTLNGRFGVRVVDVVSTEARLAGLERRR
jgi:flagellar motor switch protein FliN/FliY